MSREEGRRSSGNPDGTENSREREIPKETLKEIPKETSLAASRGARSGSVGDPSSFPPKPPPPREEAEAS